MRDIGRIAADDTGLINNVVQVVWHEDKKLATGRSEFVISAGETQYRIRVLNVASLLDAFTALSARHELAHVNPAMLRALAARLMKLTRRDLPSGEVEVDYATLERITQTDDELPKLLGLTLADNTNKTHPYTLSLVADQLGLKGWQQVDKLLKKIKEEKGINLRESDNRYHCKIKVGKKEKSTVHKWSQEAVDLFRNISNGVDIEIKD